SAVTALTRRRISGRAADPDHTGWEQFDLKNQGQCIAFVNRGPLKGDLAPDAPADAEAWLRDYQPPSALRSYLSSGSPSSKTSSLRSVKDSRNHWESSRPTPLLPAPPNGAS